VTTLKQIRMPLLAVRDRGLVFDGAETILVEDVIVAVTTR
jgi:hypothetical protein